MIQLNPRKKTAPLARALWTIFLPWVVFHKTCFPVVHLDSDLMAHLGTPGPGDGLMDIILNPFFTATYHTV